MFLVTFKTLAKQEIQQVICDLPHQMGGFEGQRRNSLHPVYHPSSDYFLMYPRTSRRRGCSSDQQSLHQLLKAVGINSLEWRVIARKDHLGGTKQLKKLFEQRKMPCKTLLQDRSSSDLQSRYTEVRKAALRQYKNPRSHGKS